MNVRKFLALDGQILGIDSLDQRCTIRRDQRHECIIEGITTRYYHNETFNEALITTIKNSQHFSPSFSCSLMGTNGSRGGNGDDSGYHGGYIFFGHDAMIVKDFVSVDG